MSQDLLEPPSEDLGELYAAERSASPMSAIEKARLLGRVKGATTVAAVGAAGTMSAKLMMGAAFVFGSVVGAAGYAVLGPPRVEVREVMVEVPIEVPTSIPAIDAGVSAPQLTPVPEANAVRADAGTHRESTLTAERRLLDAARAAQARGRHDDANRSLTMHRRRYEHGALAEERDALEIEVRIAEHRVLDARELLAAFERKYPDSIYAGRLRRRMTSFDP